MGTVHVSSLLQPFRDFAERLYCYSVGPPPERAYDAVTVALRPVGLLLGAERTLTVLPGSSAMLVVPVVSVQLVLPEVMVQVMPVVLPFTIRVNAYEFAPKPGSPLMDTEKLDNVPPQTTVVLPFVVVVFGSV
jgi:hypothetical protein